MKNEEGSSSALKGKLESKGEVLSQRSSIDRPFVWALEEEEEERKGSGRWRGSYTHGTLVHCAWPYS